MGDWITKLVVSPGRRLPQVRRPPAALYAAAAACALSMCVARRRPPVAHTLVEELFLGRDPLAETAGLQDVDVHLDEGMTHVNYRDIDMVLEMAPQPVSFWLELGAFEGGSAVLTAERAKAKSSASHTAPSEVSIVAVDTFLGDARVLWERPAAERSRLLRADGTVALLDRFKANVLRAGHADSILPMPATSVVALRVVLSLAHRGVVPHPQVIYLDSAHEEGEVLLELRLAWEALAPEGILFGDDWLLPGPGDPTGGVRRDVLRFAEAHESELDDTLGPIAQPMRTLGRPRPGLFVSYNSFQWFLRKRASAAAGPSTATKAPSVAPTAASYDCWSDGYNEGTCCDEARHGPGGNKDCWDLVFTFEQCCPGGSNR
eukprot:gnl/TRDRNA2_/TRDRNA2_86661_c0_seq1.p1 gnl/TRDRNA2_/TRDRNA2_86661_c0~~gnl/TRDRNA2_/TRDRNA2_86661_c0_seq1.p1  ORF type:complete len:375 (+),score=54.73 gnl/TRDRNA2_/TRDRNA2_86661_c0_seq1:101-1225(+)